MGYIYRNLQPISIPADGRVNNYDKKVSKYYTYDGKRRRWIIGAVTTEGMMIPNENFRRLYPDLWKQHYGQEVPAMRIVRIGMYALTLSIGYSNGIYPILQKSVGPEFGNALMDFSMYNIQERSNVAQHFSSAMEEQMVFTRKPWSDSAYSDLFSKDLSLDRIHAFRTAWLNKYLEPKQKSETKDEAESHEDGEPQAKKVWLCIDGSNNDCAVSDSELAQLGHAKSLRETEIVSFMWAVDSETGMPVTWFVNNGSMPDCKAVDEMIRFLADKHVQIEGAIVDRGFASQAVLDLITSKKMEYIVMLKSNTNGYREMMLRHAEEIRGKVTKAVSDDGIFGITDNVKVFGNSGSDSCVGLFFVWMKNCSRGIKLLGKIRKKRRDLEALIREGKKPVVPTEFKKYLKVEEQKDGTCTVNCDYDQWQADTDGCGFHAIASSSDRTAEEIHSLYQLRDVSEKQFSILKSQLGGDTTRVHSDHAIEARFAVAFIASVIRTEIMNACKRLDLDTNEMIRKTNRAYMLRLTGGSYEFVENLPADLLQLLACFGVQTEHLRKLADDINLQESQPVYDQNRKLPSIEPKHVGRKKGSKNKATLEREAKMAAAGETKPLETTPPQVKKGPGRPPGSKNKATLEREAREAAMPPKEKRGPGRPPGSKNKKTLAREAAEARHARVLQKRKNKKQKEQTVVQQ